MSIKLFSLLFLLVSALFVKAQSTIACLQPVCKQTIQLPALDTIFAQFTTSDGYKSIAWSQLSGPNTAVMGNPIVNYTSGLQAISIVPLSGLVVGTYVFKSIGTSMGGSVVPATDSLIVLPAKPVIPIRTVVSITTIYVNGVGTTKITYSDGTTQ